MQILPLNKIQSFQKKEKTNYTVIGKEMSKNEFEKMIVEAENSEKISEPEMKLLWKKRLKATR